MKRKIVAIMLAAVVVSASVVGCGENKTTETESKKVQTTTVATTKKTTSNHDAIKKYIEKADKIVIVKDAKNLDMEKAVSSVHEDGLEVQHGAHHLRMEKRWKAQLVWRPEAEGCV